MILVGFLGQALFAGRAIYQWIASERAGRSIVPPGYWRISLAGSCLVLAYAGSVADPVFVLSLLPGAVVATRNLFIRHAATRLRLIPWLAALAAVALAAALARPRFGPPAWVAVGLAGSLLWGLRFVTQWWVSERLGASTLPPAFWLLSLGGSALLLAYALFIRDPAMIAGYALGCVPYVRNLLLPHASSGAPSGMEQTRHPSVERYV